MVLFGRGLAVFAVDAALGLLASTVSGAAAALTFGWLDPMTAVCALALAVTVTVRSASVGAGAGVAPGRSRCSPARPPAASLRSNSGWDPQQFPMIVEAGAAAVIAVTTHGPFGEVGRATGRSLPAMRLLAAVGMCGLAILALQLGVVGESLNDGILVLARNVIGFAGLGLACSLVTGGLLAWVLPLGYMAFCQYALIEAWSTPWTWPARRPGRRLDRRHDGPSRRPARLHASRPPYPSQR